MLDIKDLENRWKKYNSRRKRPLIFLSIFTILIGGGFFAVQNHFINVDNYVPKSIQNKVSTLLEKDNSSQKVETTKTTIDIVQSSKVKKGTYLVNSKISRLDTGSEPSSVVHKEKTQSTAIDDSPIDPDEVFVDSDIAKPIIEKKNVRIIKVANTNAYKDVEMRFKRSHNINDAVFLANMYYKKKNYKKAIYWAMQTNKLDNNIEESWLIFAKSKVKIGHKNEAIRILREYIKRSNSYEAKKLLKSIIN